MKGMEVLINHRADIFMNFSVLEGRGISKRQEFTSRATLLYHECYSILTLSKSEL
jgi:hypothetical protein